MSKFDLERIDAVIGKQTFYKLLKDDVCEFDEFVAQIRREGSFDNEIAKIYALMQQVAELKTLPKEQFRELPNPKSEVKEYEIKTKHLRVYLFHQTYTGKIIVIGGKKLSKSKTLHISGKSKKSILKT
jgi:hypothetical protein